MDRLPSTIRSREAQKQLLQFHDSSHAADLESVQSKVGWLEASLEAVTVIYLILSGFFRSGVRE